MFYIIHPTHGYLRGLVILKFIHFIIPFEFFRFVKIEKYNSARDIPQILLLLGHFVIKKVPVKNC